MTNTTAQFPSGSPSLISCVLFEPDHLDYVLGMKGFLCVKINYSSQQNYLKTGRVKISQSPDAFYLFLYFKKSTYCMDKGKNNEKRKNLENLRRKIQSDLKSRLPLFNSRTEISQKFSQNSVFLFQEYYRLGQKIGEGAHGVVKKVHQIQSGNLFAAKILKADEQKIQAIKENFIMCRVVKHSSIIQHHQLFINRKKQQVFLIMEYCPYLSLQSSYKSLNNRAEIAHIIKSLLEAVCELHKNGICHRDLKLQNILYERTTGEVKIIDLGISKLIFNRKTGQKQTMWSRTGTIHYKAPQMFEGSEYDEKIDAWALGVITYQLAYGKLPFNSEFQMTLIEQIIRKQVQFQEPVHSEDQLLISFIQGLLKKNSKRRMNCFQALRHPFIEHSQKHTRMSRYQDIFHLDGFSSKISRSHSLSVDKSSSRQSSVQGRRTLKIRELTQTLISDSHRSC